MVSLLIGLTWFWKAMRMAVRDPSFRLLGALTAALLLFGTWVFHQVEGWAYLDSFYFSAISLATVGYGDFTPKTAAGKLLTIFYIFTGFGLLAALLTRFADVLIQSEREGRKRRRLMQARRKKAPRGAAQERNPRLRGTMDMTSSPLTKSADAIAAETRAVAKEAYIYGFPIVDNLRIQYAYFVDRASPDYKAPYNRLVNIPRAYTHEDTALQTPNSDTPYSWCGLDLRAEPLVITAPPIAPERYFSVQLIDLYTHNFDYIGSRTTGNGGGHFLIAGPDWQGEPPAGITKTIRCETALAVALFRTQLFTVDDLDNVKAIQAQYAVQPLSAFLGRPAPAAAPAIAFPTPLTPEAQQSSLEFFSLLNFALQFCPTHPSEQELMARFAAIGVGAGLPFDPETLAPETQQAIAQGMADAWADFAAGVQRANEGTLTSGDVFGTREFLANNYLYRMLGAALGIYGNTQAEAIYLPYYIDADGRQLNGASRYTLRFGPGLLPPVNSFWSLTMYTEPTKLLAANPLNRYLLNSTMLGQFQRDADGGLTLLIQHESPGAAHEANWLPAPAGPFSMMMRLYWPQAAALDGTWTAPPLNQAG